MPFLDVTRTLLDTSQPLAVRDRSEWGDVRYSKQREQIEKISPMNIDTPIVMPPMLIITSYLDEIVPYWHSAKWVAKQRQSNPSSARNITLLIEEDSSHTESRDQFLAQERENIEAAFIIHLLNE